MDILYWTALGVSIVSLGLLYTKKTDVRILDNFALCSVFLNLPPLFYSIMKKYGEVFLFLFPIGYFASVFFLAKGLVVAIKDKEVTNRVILILWAVSTLLVMMSYFPTVWLFVLVILSGGEMCVLAK